MKKGRKGFALTLFCSFDKNACKIHAKEFIFNKVAAFNFTYLTVCNFTSTQTTLYIFFKFFDQGHILSKLKCTS